MKRPNPKLHENLIVHMASQVEAWSREAVRHLNPEEAQRLWQKAEGLQYALRVLYAFKLSSTISLKRPLDLPRNFNRKEVPMGQYHLIVNLNKRQYLHPNHLGDGLKLLEFADGGATLTALALLLAKDNGRGLGDLHVAPSDTPLDDWEKNDYGLKRMRTPYAHLVGSWAGDRIVIAGDYCDNLPGREENLYHIAQRDYEDISVPMRELINCDKWLKEKFKDQFGWAEYLSASG